jgi:hypothetical protein
MVTFLEVVMILVIALFGAVTMFFLYSFIWRMGYKRALARQESRRQKAQKEASPSRFDGRAVSYLKIDPKKLYQVLWVDSWGAAIRDRRDPATETLLVSIPSWSTIIPGDFIQRVGGRLVVKDSSLKIKEEQVEDDEVSLESDFDVFPNREDVA